MLRKTLAIAALCACTGCGSEDDGCKNPVASCETGGGGTETVQIASVKVTYPGGPIYIGAQTQFQATVTKTDGTAGPATGVVWASDAPNVASVSSSGIVTPLKAGEATITAEVNPTRATLRVRVYPNFGGTWSGAIVVVNCEGIGVFVAAFCAEDSFHVGQILTHESKLNQTNDTVDAEVMFGDGASARTSGSIAVDGELQLSTGTVLPTIEGANTELRNWRSRADEPSRMTGTHQLHVTIAGIPGSATISFRLENVVKASAPASASGKRNGGLQATLRRAVAGIGRR